MERKHPKICLVSVFFHQAFFIPLSNIRKIIFNINPESISIIAALPESTDKITPDFKKDEIIIYTNQLNPLFRAVNYFILNLKISWRIFIRSGDADSFLFFMETGLPLPMTMAKLRNKRIIWLLPSSLGKMMENHHDFLDLILIPMQSLSYDLADKIVLYSPNLIQEWRLQNYSNKIHIAHEHIIDFDNINVSTPLSDRTSFIGYIGRLNTEKCIQNFVKSLPAILSTKKDLRVLIVGDGPLKESIHASLIDENLSDRVDLPGWVAHDDLPKYLNQLRLLVLPSYTEGLPNIILEAMACGTPVLATPVGAIPDMIRDGETGFIMEDNSPESIAENVLRVLRHPDLEHVAENGRYFVERNFTFDKTLEQWKRIFDEI
jgi:glycosyltransferase involved in cell wall biosynthesis